MKRGQPGIFTNPAIERAYRVGAARHYAQQARERNKPECPCDGCKVQRGLPAVQRILAAWSPLQKFNTKFL